jgi:hypothetical protein
MRELDPNNFVIRESAFKENSLNRIHLSDIKELNKKECLFKVGRTTGLTKGDIYDAPITVCDNHLATHQREIFYNVLMEEIESLGKSAIWLDRQILVGGVDGPFMKKGDSGCIWSDYSGKIVALGHGSIRLRGTDYAVGSPINAVLNAFYPLILSLYLK